MWEDFFVTLANPPQSTLFGFQHSTACTWSKRKDDRQHAADGAQAMEAFDSVLSTLQLKCYGLLLVCLNECCRHAD